MSSLEEQARANATNQGGSWGYRRQLEIDETFRGRYRGTELATGGEFGDQTLFLFWDDDGVSCYMRGHSSLVRQMEAASPGIGDDVVVARTEDYESGGNTGYSYGVAKGPNASPLPEDPADDW